MPDNNDMSLRALMPQGDQSVAGQQYAQASGLLMRPIGGGMVQVINPRTGQVLYTGSAAGAANAQASNAGVRRIID